MARPKRKKQLIDDDEFRSYCKFVSGVLRGAFNGCPEEFKREWSNRNYAVHLNCDGNVKVLKRKMDLDKFEDVPLDGDEGGV